MDKEWYREDIKKIASIFNTSLERGLTSARIVESRRKFGQNILSKEKAQSTADIFINQFKSPLIYVLLIASALVFILGDLLEAIVIFLIVLINSIVGTIQEGKAQNTLLALSRVIKSYVLVIRNGRQQKIPDYELVPGDILVLKDGESVGADARVFESNSLMVNESSLTGESIMVSKIAEPITAAGLASSDQVNMIFRGTYVVSGAGKAIVIRTGTKTIIGGISEKLSDLQMDVPLKRNIANLSKIIVYAVTFVALVTFVIGLKTGYELSDLFATIVAISVSAIPESLPVVVTLVLATGVWRMSRQKVLVKKLQAVEALGQAKVVALDKTGTITKNQMAVEKIFINNEFLSVTGLGYEPKGALISGHKRISADEIKGLDLFLTAAALTATAEVIPDNADGEWKLHYGDPTEAALLVLGKKFGYDKAELTNKYQRILEIPFDMRNKYHAAVHLIKGKETLMVAGSPEAILHYSKNILINGRSSKITETNLDSINDAIKKLSTAGYRVLAIALNREDIKDIGPKHLPVLTFVGLVGISDAIRPEVVGAVESVKKAGMKVLMITGDHLETALAIAKKVGIYGPKNSYMTGAEIREIDDFDLPSRLEKVTVFARVTPDDKLRIIEAYKRRGETIAMTGDGVNDALSLVAADLGVSMGKIGTEVAREASDIVLLDDNFGNIVSAAEEGRNIYQVIRRTTLFLLATSAGELLLILFAILLGMPIPLTPIQIIWLNLITDTFLVSAMALDPKGKNLLKEKFTKPSKYLVDWFMGFRILLVSGVMVIVTLWLFNQYLEIDMRKALTISLTLLTVFHFYNIFNVRSDKESALTKKCFENKYVLFGLAVALLLHLFAIYNPFMQNILHTTNLGWLEWVIIFALGSSILLVEEIRKIFHRKLRP
ncbi:MAG TPA: HAD-IC family P-type ATPase [Candidatus Paceibacterota bacterium]|nr:HAD-IC family P-type ATPase [Candidatus Paceibacterota bacterium]HRZ34431.1 HAD-IC family P-type ATPase [Candidatus Paceibacterota bacterium]